jgi:3-keto-disaccharide hydrolase
MSHVRMRALLIVVASLTSPAARAEDGPLLPLFNGKDLSGWVNVNCAPGTFTVRDEMIVSTGVPTGVMRTERQYENFVIELEWRHMKPGGNAGLFIWGDGVTAPGTPFARGIEVQILDGRNSETYTSHGDVFSIHGAHMKPDRPHPWQGRFRRQRMPAAQGVHLPRIGRLGMSLSEHPAGGTSLDQSAARGDRRRRPGVQIALHGRRPQRVENGSGQ